MATARTTITDAAIDPDKMMLAGVVDTTAKGAPRYTVSEMARFFFGKTNHWVRWLEEGGKMVLNGERVGDRRNEKDMRVYYLEDVELIAHALAVNGAISGEQFRQTLLLVKVSAQMKKLI